MRARIAAKIHAARMDRAEAVPAATEPHYSPLAVAKLWGISVDKARRLFRDVPGVLKIGNVTTRCGKHEYVTLRIPQSVLERVHAEWTR